MPEVIPVRADAKVPVVVPPAATQFVVGAGAVPKQVPRAEMAAGTPREVTFAPNVAPVVVMPLTVGVVTVGTAVLAVYVPLKLIVPPEVRVKLCDVGVVYPATGFHVMVYVPVGCEADVCDVPEPVMVAGPVMVQEDAMFEETATVPREAVLRLYIETVPELMFPT